MGVLVSNTNRTTETKLSPCPFCGWKNPTEVSSGIDVVYIECADCGAEGPTGESRAEADAGWNRRAAPEPRVDVADLNRELCEKEGHVLGVECRPCLRCHAQFAPTKEAEHG